MNIEFKVCISRIVRYDDFTKGWMEISGGGEKKVFECFWRTNIGCVTKGSSELPGGEGRIRYRMMAPYHFAMVLVVNRLVTFPIVPYKELDYGKIGCNILIRNEDGSLVDKAEYEQLALMLQHNKVVKMQIDEEREMKKGELMCWSSKKFLWFD